MKNFLLLFIIALCCNSANAQNFIISGTVKNNKGERLVSATVFIAGSQRGTATDKDGHFEFANVAPGTYQLVVNMLGYTPVKQNVLVKDGPGNVELTLGEKTIMLNEVIIGDVTQRKKHLKTFVKYFLGESDNAKACKILNPEVIEFSTQRSVLKATTPDFLMIENSKLGYKIKYLLRKFEYSDRTEVTFYEGDCIFEPLDGTPEQKLTWAANRKEAYYGSLMHYLRSVYANNARGEGFLIYKVIGPGFPLMIESLPIPSEQLVKRPDSNFMVFRSDKRFYIVYDKKKAAKEDKMASVETIVLDDLDRNGSLFLVDSQIDRRGSYADHKQLLIQGFWGRKRLGDQLPLEYAPE